MICKIKKNIYFVALILITIIFILLFLSKERMESRIDRAILEINSRCFALENLMEGGSYNSLDVWHMTNFLKQPYVVYYKVLDEAGSVVVEFGREIDSTWRYLTKRQLLKDRGRVFAILEYSIDKKYIIKEMLRDDFFYILSITILLLVVGHMWPFFAIIDYRRKQKILDMLANSEERELLIEQAEMDASLGQVAKRIVAMQDTIKTNAIFTTIGQSTSHIAHDMRSPLTVLKTFIQYAKCGEDNDSLELESAAKNSVKRLNDMADELLDYSKATKIEKAVININTLINDSVKSAKVNAEMKGVNIIYTNELDVAEINADSYRIGRVMTNIINNSIQAMDVLPCDMRDAVCVNKVNITTYIDEKNLVIKVRDNGKGIKEEDLPKIFDAFFTSGKKGGTGLGLSYCKQVVEAHGGEITVESKVGKGAEFKIAIPV